MTKENKFLTGVAVAATLIIPISAFASGALNWFNGFGWKMLSDSTFQTILQSKGVTLPSADEIKTYQDAMKSAQDAFQKLTDADKADIEKARRDAMRAKGIVLPSEDEIAKFQALKTQIDTVMKNLTPDEKKQLSSSMKWSGMGTWKNAKGMPRSGRRGMQNLGK